MLSASYFKSYFLIPELFNLTISINSDIINLSSDSNIFLFMPLIFWAYSEGS